MSLLTCEQFPRSSKYNPEWVVASASGGANSLWLAEWLATAMDLREGMSVLDLGCGRAASSIFLHREFGVKVWAADLWFSATENALRIRGAGALSFPAGYFDAIVSIDSFVYYGTDDTYLNYLARFLKPGGRLGIAGAGLMRELDGPVPEHLKAWWTPELWCLHSAAWWRRHWEKTGIVTVETADDLPDGWKLWRDWHAAVAPDNKVEIAALEADAGRTLGYVRAIGRRNPGARLEEPITSIPERYVDKPLLRGGR